MTFREFIRFAYGLVMGTSVQYVKPRQRFLWPTKVIQLDETLSLMLGGSCICGILHAEKEAILINTNQGSAAEDLRSEIQRLGITKINAVINTSMDVEFAGGNSLFSDAERWVHADTLMQSEGEGEIERKVKFGRFGHQDGKCIQNIAFREEIIHVIPVNRFRGAQVVEDIRHPGSTRESLSSMNMALNSQHMRNDDAESLELVVFLENEQILFTGGLFFNRIHPPLANHANVDLTTWASVLEELLVKWNPKVVVPAEGGVATADDIRSFVAYLRALGNPQVEFQECRRRFDWIEIPGHTSLEENFDWVRENQKTHTTL